MSTDWVEVGDRCWVRRYSPWDVSSGVVAGDDGLLVIDTRADAAQGRELAGHVRELSSLPVLAVMNTHAHFDHLGGNAAFPGCPVVAHAAVPLALERGAPEPEAPLATEEKVLPDTVFAHRWDLDLGGREVEATHLGRGHTDGDAILLVPDADVVYVGDLVEQSGPPSFGPDCWPLEWGPTLERLASLLDPVTSVVPGHGDVVDVDFVSQQARDVTEVAEHLRLLVAAHVPEADALSRGPWPFPVEGLAVAVHRGYRHLGAGHAG
ncbi:MAG TPA: MBL fold metallo-hydrolase [Oryzihumus sp.]|nr:MBL fold metallo-hydrolase [Oryzihumus sp.]